MGNKGAFITLIGGDLKPNYTSYDAVVIVLLNVFVCGVVLS